MATSSDVDLQFLLRDFDSADKNKDGHISLKEAKSFLRHQGYYEKDQQKQFFRDFDVDHDEKISRDEFIAGIHKIPRTAHTTAKIRKTFQAIDKNKDGRLDKREIKALFQQMSQKDLSQKQVNQLMANVDKNHDGFIEYDEMLDMFIKQGLI